MFWFVFTYFFKAGQLQKGAGTGRLFSGECQGDGESHLTM